MRKKGDSVYQGNREERQVARFCQVKKILSAKTSTSHEILVRIPFLLSLLNPPCIKETLRLCKVRAQCSDFKNFKISQQFDEVVESLRMLTQYLFP